MLVDVFIPNVINRRLEMFMSLKAQDAGDYRVDVNQKKTTISGVLDLISAEGGLVGHSDAFAAIMSMSKLFPRFAGLDGDAPLMAMKSEEPGTKPLLAFHTGIKEGGMSREDAIRLMVADTVNHLVNDLAVTGAVPRLAQDVAFVDHLAPGEGEFLVKTMVDISAAYGMFICGGEISEQPDIFANRNHITPCIVALGELLPSEHVEGPRDIRIGDKLVCVAANGPHTNGYTLIRDIFMRERPDLCAHRLKDGRTALNAVLEPHMCYLQLVRAWLEQGLKPHGLAHITGGGISDNLRRILPDAVSDKAVYDPLPCNAEIDLTLLRVPEIFQVIRDSGSNGPRSDEAMLRTFNMGAGLVAVIDPSQEESLVKIAEDQGCEAYAFGEIVGDGEREVVYKGALNWENRPRKAFLSGYSGLKS